MKNVLVLAEKGNKIPFWKQMVEKYPAEFPDNYSYAHNAVVFHAEDKIIKFTKDADGEWETNGYPFIPLTLNSVSVPEDTFLIDGGVGWINILSNPEHFDEIICINDADMGGILSCAKILEDNNIDFSKAKYVWFKYLSEDTFLAAVKEAPSFLHVWEKVIEKVKSGIYEDIEVQCKEEI